jgi:sialic acid synthase SpsE
VALGASVIEKHFTLARADGGVDSAFSLEPQELASLVVESERSWKALGQVRYGPTEKEKKSLVFRRSIYVAQDIAEGEIFTKENLKILRPGYGAPPSLFRSILGSRASQNYTQGQPLLTHHLA